MESCTHLVVQATRVLPSILSCSGEIHKGSVKVSRSLMTIGKRVVWLYILIDDCVVAVYRIAVPEMFTLCL